MTATSLTAHQFVPRGGLLEPAAFASRHRLLRWLLIAHVPLLAALGLFQGFGAAGVVLETLPVVVAWALGGAGDTSRWMRARAVLVTAGFSWSSIVLVHFSGGSIEAHFHFFIILGFIALYQDWLPFLWYVAFTVLSHGLGSALAPGLIFDHTDGQAAAWGWSAVHGAGVAALAAGLVIFWSNTEAEQRRATGLAVELSDRTLEQTRKDLQERSNRSTMLLALARRNQAIIQRQLDSIERLESQDLQPDTLEELFSLDHMATRMRRNAESLLVLSGAEPVRTWQRPMPLSEILRASASEVEDFERVDFVLPDDIEVDGGAASDLSHLFAELIENAITFSPPSTRIQVSAMRTVSGETLVSIRDHGVGLTDQQAVDAEQLLAGGSEASATAGGRLGLTVVGRLAARHGVHVALDTVSTGGAIAQVNLPGAVVGDAGSRSGARAEESPTLGQRHRADVPELPPATVPALYPEPPRAEPALAAATAAPAHVGGPALATFAGLPKRSRDDGFDAPGTVDLWGDPLDGAP